jgi:predicted MPP superfamily phosphohydrolase
MRENDFEVRKESIFATVQQPFSILYLSDFHFNGWSGEVVKWMVDRVTELQPDIILLGGDYVDTRKGVQWLELFLEEILERKHVYAIAGNHDYFFGIKKIEKLFLDRDIVWIENEAISIQLKGMQINIAGNRIKENTNSSDFSILCVHNPKVLNGNLETYYLAFGGHLHGSQFVFWENEKGLYPGKLFYKWNVLSKEKDECKCLISKGLGDTLPFRYNCKKDMILVEVKPEIYKI